MPASADELIELLDLELIDVDLYRGRQPRTDRQRVFGGQVAAQALLAGIRSVDPAYVVHSLHSYFLRPGDHSVPIVYDVERLRDGRSFATRRVVARQHGRLRVGAIESYVRSDDHGLLSQVLSDKRSAPAELRRLARRERDGLPVHRRIRFMVPRIGRFSRTGSGDTSDAASIYFTASAPRNLRNQIIPAQ